MTRENDHKMSRKEFMSRSTAGLVGFGVAGCSTPGLLKKTSQEVTIKYRTLGKTGLKVTAVGSGATRTDAPSVINRVVNLGVNFIDTGRMYAGGKNEEIIGKIVKDIRKNIVIQSKFSRRNINDRKAIEKSIDDSLKALQTDYIDIMLLHGPTSEEQLNSPTVLEILDKAKKSGKIRFCGFSCHGNQAETLKAAVKGKFYDVAMIAYNHAGHYWHQGGAEEKPFDKTGEYYEWDQSALEKVMEKATNSGMGLVAMKTCSAGPLKENGQSEATYTAALRWILKNKNISSVVPGMGNFREVDEDVQAMWVMLQQDKPQDYVIATGESHSVRELVELAFKEIGTKIEWRGSGIEEVGVVKEVTRDERQVTRHEEGVGGGAAKPRDLKSDAVESDFRKRALRAGDVVVEVDRRYFRPTEVDELLGDASKAERELGWKPKISFHEMVSEMVKGDLEEAMRDQFCKERGFRVLKFTE